MADRYWNPSAAANWSDVDVWALTDGGTADQAVPTSSDNVYFTSTNNNNCTIDIASSFKDFDCNGGTGYTGTISNVSYTLSLYGSLHLNSTMTWTCGGGLYFYATTSGNTIRSGNHSLTTNTVLFRGSGEYTFLDNCTITSSANGTAFWGGTLNFNGKTITTPKLNLNLSQSVRVLNLTNSTLILTGAGIVFNTTNIASLTTDFTGSLIKLTNNSATDKEFNCGDFTFNNLWDSTQGTGTLTTTQNGTFNDIKIDSGRTFIITDSTTLTMSSLSATGTSGNEIIIESSTSGTKANITTPSDFINGCDYIDFTDIAATPNTLTWYVGDNSTGTDSTGLIFESLTITTDNAIFFGANF